MEMANSEVKAQMHSVGGQRMSETHIYSQLKRIVISSKRPNALLWFYMFKFSMSLDRKRFAKKKQRPLAPRGASHELLG